MRIEVGIGFGIRYVDSLPIYERATHDKVTARQSWEEGVIDCHLLRRHLVDCNEMKQPAFEHHHCTERRIAEAGRICYDRIKYRLEVRWRSTDDIEHIARCGLIFKRLRELLGPFSELSRPRLFGLEQPCVLDGDHCLVGESLEELDLGLREPTHLLPHDHDHSD